MKKIIQNIKKHCTKLLVLPLLAGMTSCELDYRNTEAIDPEGVWGDENMIQAYLTDIYGLMPGWNFGGDGSDESGGFILPVRPHRASDASAVRNRDSGGPDGPAGTDQDAGAVD